MKRMSIVDQDGNVRSTSSDPDFLDQEEEIILRRHPKLKLRRVPAKPIQKAKKRKGVKR